jgi:RimJ/RimL family protein N-acetyltransferase
MLKGEQVGLRPMASEDVWHLYKWYNDRRVVEDLGLRHGLFCVSVDEERAIVEKKLTSPTNRDFIIVDLGMGKAIGWAGLSHIDLRNSSAKLDLVIGEISERGQGKEEEAARMMVAHAFEVMNLHRVYLRVPCYNDRAIACFKASGFEIEGTLRDDHHHNGELASSHIMSVLRDEEGRR